MTESTFYCMLPDDRPITSICIIEDSKKYPPGYHVVSKSYDQDLDADLWKDGGLFWKKVTRYLCISKTEGRIDYVLESLAVVHEKENPPVGFSLVSHTTDSEQKAWKKKQLCYRMAHKSTAMQMITDIIILSNFKSNNFIPSGFVSVGEINGLHICYKNKSASPLNKGGIPSELPYIPNVEGESDLVRRFSIGGPGAYRPSNLGPNSRHPSNLSLQNAFPNGRPNYPSSTLQSQTSYNNALEGVPFILNPRYVADDNSNSKIELIEEVSLDDITNKYYYDFSTEKQTLPQ